MRLVYFLHKTSRWRHNVSNMLKRLHFNKVPASYQLLTCKRVRFVCAAICLFSSSVGYGCWRRGKKVIQFDFMLTFYVYILKMKPIYISSPCKMLMYSHTAGLFRNFNLWKYYIQHLSLPLHLYGSISASF